MLAVALLGLAGYWLLVLSEGTYLGPRAVAWLYDRVARRYDRIKGSDPADDARYLARPLLLTLDGVAQPRVLDVATGTGRLPEALLAEGGFDGCVLGVDRSPGMLAEARRKLASQPGAWALALADAGRLPFPAGTFDAVTCLEALEFTASPPQTLRELLRVLRVGGTLLVTNRVGVDALWYPGRSCGRGSVERRLAALGATEIEREAWQAYYDLIWASKPQA